MQERYADIIVNIVQSDLDRSFQYRVPETLLDAVHPGSRVTVPFGGGKRTLEGYVISLSDEPKIDKAKIKDIIELSPGGTTVESELIQLAAWMRRTYGSTMIQALKTILPVKQQKNVKSKQFIELLLSNEQVEAQLAEYRRVHHVAKERLLVALQENAAVIPRDGAISQNTHNYLEQSYVTNTLKVPLSTIRAMEKQGILRIVSETEMRNPGELAKAVSAADAEEQRRNQPLTEAQIRVRDGILSEWANANRPCLLQGVTGSGKTQVYMDLAERILQEGGDVIILIPEIALSWQTVRRFHQRFGDVVAVLHSRLSDGERSDQYRRVQSGEAKIAVGPRSALFMPFRNLQLIIVDEEQENSYRSEQAPRYDAREAAIERVQLINRRNHPGYTQGCSHTRGDAPDNAVCGGTMASHQNAHILFGSATPSIDAIEAVESGRYAMFPLTERYGEAVLPDVQVVDMREELREGNRSILSRQLLREIHERLRKKEQIMLFLNRRGFSGFVSCRSCGEVVKCPHCDVSLTYHNNGRLICHYCGYETVNVDKCPTCGSPYIGGFRAGTQKVVAELIKCFPHARVLRMDADTTKKKDDHEKILRSFANHEADILVGTQMIIKGHDFSQVTLVAALSADLSLFASDYRAAERTYQILVQAIGRAGRGAQKGTAIIQTYHPEHYAIEAAVAQDNASFFAQEIDNRQLMGYPPASNLLGIHGSAADEELLTKAMNYIVKYLQRVQGQNTVIIGPAPENIARIKDRYRQAVYVKEPSREVIVRMREQLEKYIEINSGFRKIYLQYDLNV